ncbi:hypothetical protein DSECCO2_623020 [anaerobic digester metagenome]
MANLRLTTFSYSIRIFSASSFVCAYVLTGSTGVFSSHGFPDLPYMEVVDALMSIWFFDMDSPNSRVASTLISCAECGLEAHAGNPLIPARWNIVSYCSTLSTPFLISLLIIVRLGCFARCRIGSYPYIKLSSTVTLCPLFKSFWVRTIPLYPAPPVMRMFIFFAFICVFNDCYNLVLRSNCRSYNMMFNHPCCEWETAGKCR